MSVDRLEATLEWVPGWAIGATLLALGTVLALLVHAIAMRAGERLFGGKERFGPALLAQTRGPAMLALVLLGARLIVSIAPFPEPLSLALQRILTLAFVLLVGWIAVCAIDIAAGIYLQRFRLDVEDNLPARKHVTQVHILRRAAKTLVAIITLAAGLMTFDSVRQYGVSLFASAGVAGLIVGFAARPVLSNLIAGIQLAITQPIRVDDAVVVEGEWGRIEEITSTYIVVRLWDWRRLVVPLSYFIEKPFQNWTREGTAIIGAVMIYVHYGAPVDRIRKKLEEIGSRPSRWCSSVEQSRPHARLTIAL